jgi:ABC-type uncharacterized transport system permease subunit
MDWLSTGIAIFDSGVRLAVPLLFACLAGLWSERSGVVDIGLEGKMLVAAFAGAAAAHATGSAWAGLGAGIVASTAFALIHGFAAISQRGNQIVSGVAINMLAVGLTALVGNAWYKQGGRTPPLEGAARFEPITLPGAEAIRGVPVIGPLYADVISGHTVLVYVAVLATVVTAWVLASARASACGMRAVGENPAAVDTAGISVVGLRYGAVAMLAGVLCGIGGAYLAVAQAAGFLHADDGGASGFIALAAVIFAKLAGVAGARVPACCSACSTRWRSGSKGVSVAGHRPRAGGGDPGACPIALTVVLLAGFIGRATPPRASGLPYVKER